MRLEYVRYKEGHEYFGRKILTDEVEKRNYYFAPFADVPDDFGRRVLAQTKDEFRVVEVSGCEPDTSPEFACSICNFVGHSKKSLTMHTMKRHKETAK